MKKFFLTLLLLLSLFLSHNNFANKLLYSNDFSAPKDFHHKPNNYFTQGQYHILNQKVGYFYWNPYFTPPINHHIQVKMIIPPPHDFKRGREGGLIFRSNSESRFVFFIIPQTKKFALYRYEKNPKNKSLWNLITIQEDSVINLDCNILDVIHLQNKILLFINGKKVYEGPNPQDTQIPSQGFVGFYASKDSHFHFDDLFIWETNSDILKNSKTPERQKDLPQDFNDQYLKNYESLGENLFSYSFNHSEDSPFKEEKEQKKQEEQSFAHPFLGKLEVFSPDKDFKIQAKEKIKSEYVLLETSAKIEYLHESNWVGLTLQAPSNPLYLFQINPFSKKVFLTKIDNENNKILLYQGEEESIKPQEENVLALKVYKDTLTLYVNGKKLTTIKDEKDIDLIRKNYGFMSSANQSPVIFSYVRAFEINPNFIDKHIGKIFLLGIVALFWFFYNKKQKKLLQKAKIKGMPFLPFTVVKEILKALKAQNKTKISEKEIILKYQLTKKDAQEVLKILSKDFGGYLDSDNEGNLFVSFK